MKKIILPILIIFLLITDVNAVTLTQRLGDEEVKMTVAAGEVVSLKFTSKDGFQFKNWKIESGSLNIPTTSANISFVMPNSNITIRGVYDTHYTITYHANSGTGSMTSQSIIAGESGTLNVNAFTKGTATFEGWATTASGSVEYTDGQSITPTENLDLYAVWKEVEDPSIITVTYNANGGSFSSGTTNILKYKLPENTEIKTSKTANVSEDGTTADTETGYGDNQEFTDVITIDGATALSVTITYETESGYDWVCVYDDSVTPSQDNYGDSKSGMLTGSKATKTYIIEGDTVQFYFFSDDYEDSCSYYGYYAEVKALPELTSGIYETPERADYMFGGWSINSNAARGQYRGEVNRSENTTLYAIWGDSFEEVAWVGDYVEYTPPASNTCNLTAITGITQNALTPSATTKWRVLSNDGTTVELVSADSVGTLTLGSDSDATISKIHYGNVIQILRQISETYTDGEIAIAGRGLGWNGTSAETIPIDNISYEYIDTNGITCEDGDPYDDTYVQEHGGWTIEDVNVLVANNMIQTKIYADGVVWLASRVLDVGSSFVNFGVYYVFSGGMDFGYLFREFSDGRMDMFADTRGVRPVVILKSGISASAVGTEENRWKLN